MLVWCALISVTFCCLFHQITAGSTLSIHDSYLLFNNKYLSARVETNGAPWISSLQGDFTGASNYGNNLLSEGGIRLERANADGTVVTAANSGVPSKFTIQQDYLSPDCGSVLFSDVVDDSKNPMVTESWTLSLCPNDRYLTFQSTGNVLSSAESSKARAVRHAVYATPISTTGFYDGGVVQILDASDDNSHFGSIDRLQRVYFLGSTGALDIRRPLALSGDAELTVMLNSGTQTVPHLPSFASGFHEFLVGGFSVLDDWVPGNNANDTRVLGAHKWTKMMQIAPNNKNFPSSSLPNSLVAMSNADDLESFMIGIYANAVPCLCTYPNEVTQGAHVAQIATTLRHGKSRGYQGTYNYFDPDNFFSLSAMLYSGDPYLQNQVRMVIERTGTFMKTENGQLPHHFNGITPYYLALSGETQTGPNTFWTKTALRYAAVTGDIEWLKNYMPTLRKAASFVFDLISDDTNMVFAPGSLMIDVFIRNNYTSDSNAMVVGFLQDFAAAERAVGEEATAQELESLSSRVAEAVNAKLWAGSDAGADHYITQLNIDGTTRDFVDYDANLIAIANGVSDEERSRLIQKRVDRGQCAAAMGGGPQFVSEKYYGPDDTTNGNIGDSWCSMARIGWFDARGRKRFGSADDLTYFNNRLLAPVQQDVLKNTWMHERYGCDGLQQENRTMYYFEYPSYVTMLLREIRYGVEVELNSINIQPFGAPASFEYHLGTVDVSYSQTRVSISTPGSGTTTYRIYGMAPNASYRVESITSDAVEVVADEQGLLQFIAPRAMQPFALTATLVQ